MMSSASTAKAPPMVYRCPACGGYLKWHYGYDHENLECIGCRTKYKDDYRTYLRGYLAPPFLVACAAFVLAAVFLPDWRSKDLFLMGAFLGILFPVRWLRDGVIVSKGEIVHREHRPRAYWLYMIFLLTLCFILCLPFLICLILSAA
jgi:hypothetical protein